jgi:glycosyltransferase involved in cell wall biosynthesis
MTESPNKSKSGIDSEALFLDMPDRSSSGISIVIISYERMRSLAALLRSLLRQNLDGIETELIICNNSNRSQLGKSFFSSVGRHLTRFKDIKVFNSDYNWRDRIRYSLGTVAKYETLMFLDDDVVLLDPNFVRYMFNNFRKLRPEDILSCWADIWVDWQPENFRVVSLSFYEHDLEELTLVDSCGMGISMLNRRILFNPAIAGMDSIFEQIGDYVFSLMSNMELGTQCYFLPSYKMLKFHRQASKHAICRGDGFYKSVISIFQFLLENGYRPLLEREANRFQDPSSPEAKALRLISPHVFPSS